MFDKYIIIIYIIERKNIHFYIDKSNTLITFKKLKTIGTFYFNFVTFFHKQ